MITSESKTYSYKGITPTLFVGLGNFGEKVLTHLEFMLGERFTPIQDYPIFRFFRINSSFNCKDDTSSKFFDITEKLHELSISSQTYSAISEWFPSDMQPHGDFSESSLTRLHYHAAFYQNYHIIHNICNNIIRESTDHNARRSCAEDTDLIIDEGINIYIISSLWEKCSSGILWDISHLLKMETKKIIGPVRIIGILTYPDDQDNNSSPYLFKSGDLQANTYAVLKEMDFFFKGNSLSFNITKNEEIELQGNPFSLCYLIPSKNPDDENLEESVDSVRSYISLDTDIFFSPKLKSLRDQLILYLESSVLTYATGSIVFPYNEVIDWCTKRLLYRSLKLWGKKDFQNPMDDYLKRYYKIMDIKNQEQADEEFIRKMGKPKETAWHVGRQLKELIETCKTDELVEKFEEKYRILGAEEVTESSQTFNLKTKDMTANHKKLVSKLLMEMASDCFVGIHRLKSIINSLNSYLYRCHQNIEKKIENLVTKIDELERKRVSNTKILKKITSSPMLIFQKSKLNKVFDETWKLCQESLERRLSLHILTSALEYFHNMKDHVFHYKEPIDSLIEVYELLSMQLSSEMNFSYETPYQSISFINEEIVEDIYSNHVGYEEKTISDVISSLISLIPLDLSDLSNKRILRDLKNNALDVIYYKARLCFESLKEKPVTEFFSEYSSDESQIEYIRKLFDISLPNLKNFIKKHIKLRKLHFVGFFEGSYPNADASVSLVNHLTKLGIVPSCIIDIKDESQIVSLTQYSGIELECFLHYEEWQKMYEAQKAKQLLHITNDDIWAPLEENITSVSIPN